MASAMVLVLGAVPAYAQDDDDEDDVAAAAGTTAETDGDPIVVTGSRIANVGMNAPTPVTSVDS